MGLLTPKTAGQYLQLKNGSFYLHTDKAMENPYPGVEGVITGFQYKTEEFNGSPNEKLYIDINDGESAFRWGVNLNSRIYGRLISFLKSADLSRVLTITAAVEKDKKDPEKSYNTVFIQQDGEWLKSAYKKGDLPDFKKVRLNGKEMWDKEDWLNAIRNIVEKEFMPVVNKNEVATPPTNVDEDGIVHEDEDTDGQLPF